MTAHTVLVVEDDEGTRTLVVRALESRGYTVLFAEDGEKGWELVPEADFVILDLGLPKLRGEEILQRISEHGMAIPVIVITGTDFSEQKQAEMQQFGIVAFLKKPFRVKDILERVEQADAAADTIREAGETIDTSVAQIKRFVERQGIETTPLSREINPPR